MPIPCPGGTHSNAVGAMSAETCQPVEPDFWAPLGSSKPEPCPPSGFYCPGKANDEQYGGSKPILMPTGQSTSSRLVDAVTAVVDLDLACTDLDFAAIKLSLVTLYDCNAELLTLSNPCGARRARALQGLSMTITIATAAITVDGREVFGPSVEQLAAVMQAVDASTIGTSLTAALGLTVTVTGLSAPAQTSATQTVSFMCPRGQWCTAGLVVDCPLNTYNNETGQIFATACQLCPVHSLTINTSSTTLDDCLCDRGFYDSIIGPGVRCEVCPFGTSCEKGAKLDTLPVNTSFYRLSNASSDVRKCPDADANCSETFGTSACRSTSGCRGGEGIGDALCAPGLSGIFCRACAQNGTRVHYVEASNDDTAHCATCSDGTIAGSIGLVLGVVGGLVVILYMFKKLGSCVSDHTRARVQQWNREFTPLNKLKIIGNFYMIATKVDTVYGYVAEDQILLSYTLHSS